MHILFFVLFLCVVVLLWAAYAVARHIQRHNAERNQAVLLTDVDATATNTDGIPLTAKVSQSSEEAPNHEVRR